MDSDITDFFREDTGKYSIKRLLLFVVIMVALAVLVYSVATKHGLDELTKTFAEFLVGTAASVYGVVIVGNKVTDAVSGNNPPASEPPTK